MTEQSKGILTLVLLTKIFGSMGGFSRYLNTGFTIYQQVYLHVAVAVVLCVLMFRHKISLKSLKQLSLNEWSLLIVRSLSYYLFGVTLLTKAYIHTSISNVMFLGAIPLTALLGALLLKEKFTSEKTFFILLTSIGVIVIGVQDFSNLLSFGVGESAALLSSLGFSLSYATRRLHSKILNNFEMTTIQLGIAALSVFITSLFTGQSLPTATWSSGLITALLIAGFLNTIIILFSNYAFERIEAMLPDFPKNPIFQYF